MKVAQTQAGAVHSKAKCQKYDGAYAFLLSASLTGRDSSHRNSSTLDTTKRPLQIILTLCQYVINGTRHLFNVGDLSCHVALCRAISSV